MRSGRAVRRPTRSQGASATPFRAHQATKQDRAHRPAAESGGESFNSSPPYSAPQRRKSTNLRAQDIQHEIVGQHADRDSRESERGTDAFMQNEDTAVTMAAS